MGGVRDAALAKALREKLRQWRASVRADNKQALADAEEVGRKREK
jgi:hypothetical protein